MRDLAAQADVITPNLTEAALLLEEAYADLPRDEEGCRCRLEQLEAWMGGARWYSPG